MPQRGHDGRQDDPAATAHSVPVVHDGLRWGLRIGRRRVVKGRLHGLHDPEMTRPEVELARWVATAARLNLSSNWCLGASLMHETLGEPHTASPGEAEKAANRGEMRRSWYQQDSDDTADDRSPLVSSRRWRHILPAAMI